MSFNAEGLIAKEGIEVKWERVMELHLEAKIKIQETDEK